MRSRSSTPPASSLVLPNGQQSTSNHHSSNNSNNMVRFADQPRVHGPQAQLGSLGIADQEQKEVQDGRESEVEGTTEEGAGESVEDEEEVSRGNCETLFNNA